MPMIMIKCPATGKDIPTEMAMDKASFENPTNQMAGNKVGCPHCKTLHTWDKKDAFLKA